MKDLNESRKEIDALDQELASLFSKRMALSKEVALYKKENHLPIFDEARESSMIEKELGYVDDPALKTHYANLLKSVISISKSYQSEILKAPQDIQVNVNPSYLIHFGSIKEASSFFDLNRKVLLLSDTGIPTSYIEALQKQGKEVYTYVIEQGEKSKNIKNFQSVISFMLKHEFSRKDCLLSLGGGVVGDLGGYIASSYMRGIAFYNIPTSLLSMIDSSIGGKTAIDFKTYKNSVGSFYQPKGVLIDTSLLKSLDSRQYASGMAEAIKMAAILDQGLFERLEAKKASEEEIIHRCIELKKEVVEQDEKEGGLRKILNFGHTIGHAIEAQKEGVLFHGECVGLGMIPFCEEKERLRKVLESYHLPLQASFSLSKAKKLMLHDKKASLSKIDIIKVERMGSCQIVSMEIKQIMEALKKGEILCPTSLEKI